MKQPECRFEQQIGAAMRTGLWTPELQAHAAQCDSCAETMLVAGALLEASNASPASVPAAGLVWWKAELQRRREAQERVQRPLRVIERFAPLLGLGAAVWGTAWVDAPSSPWLVAAVVGFAILLATAGSVYWLAARRR